MHDTATQRPTPLQISAGFVIQLVAFGALYTFGAVLDEVRASLAVSRSSVALIPAVAAACLFIVGPVTGRLADRRGTAFVIRLGAVTFAAGLGLTSVASTVWVALAGFGILAGVAVGCVYVPVVASIASRAGASGPVLTGVVVAGVGIGTATMAPVIEALSAAMGWRGAYRLYAVIGSALLLVASVPFTRAKGTVAPPTAASFRSAMARLGRLGEFRRLYAGLLLASPSIYVGLVFLASYASAQDIARSRAALLLSLFGLTSTAGRLLLTALGRRRGASWVFRQCFVALTISLLLWAVAGGSYATLLVYAVVAGAGYGGLIGLAPTVTAVTFGAAGLATTLGVLYTSLAVGGLLTGPLAGAAIDRVGYRPTLLALAVLTSAALVCLPRDRSSHRA